MNLRILNSVNMFSKIMGLSVMIVLIFVGLAYFKVLPELEHLIHSERELAIKENTEVAYSIIETQYKKAQSGKLTELEAKEIAIEEIKQLRFDGGSGYFWINDYEPNMIMHPIKPDLDGKSLTNSADPNGKKLFVEMAKVVKKSSEGYVDYQWAKVGSNVPVDKISYVKGFEPWKWIIGTGVYIDDIDLVLGEIRNNLIIIFLVVLVFIIGITFVLAKSISTPLKNLQALSTKVAEGNVDVSVDDNRRDEIGLLSKSFNKMTLNIKTLLSEVEQKGLIAEQSANNAKTAQEKAQEQEAYLSRNVKTLLGEMEKFSKGDLLVNVIAEKQDDDISRLFDGFNSTVLNIKNMIMQVKEAVLSTSTASSEISSSAEEMAAGAQEQSSQTSEVAAAMEEMSRTIVETASNATVASEASKVSSDKANEGVSKVKDAKDGMTKIVESAETTGEIISSLTNKTDQIGEIAQVIDEIADQTNLLALNAAIEAARAGEQGRGFAVVADEVRKLAERTTKATKEIAETIKAIQTEAKEADTSMKNASGSVKEGMQLNDEVEEVLFAILESAENVTTQIGQVAAASEEQSATAEEVSTNVEAINNVSNESASVVQQIAASSEDLNKLTENLNQLVEQFKLEDDSRSTTGLNNRMIE
jgi:methyl-accepting chemotaxis protein